MGAQRWVLAYEGDAGGLRVTGGVPLPAGRRLEVGREGELALGVSVPSTRISRRALAVTAGDHGWRLEVGNRGGAVIHPWGQAPVLPGVENTVNWPLVAVRMLPDTGGTQHWVLIEADDLTVTRAGAIPPQPLTTHTDRAERPGDLPSGELEAVRTVFAAQLSWPPRHPAEALLLKQAATQLGISISGVQERLKSAQNRAARLGLQRGVGLTDPAYLHVLVGAGYLAVPAGHHHQVGLG